MNVISTRPSQEATITAADRTQAEPKEEVGIDEGEENMTLRIPSV
jgi:hypothetical protein